MISLSWHWPILASVVPRSIFLGDTSVPLPEFQSNICKFWGTQQIHLIFTCKIENSFPEISVHFYSNLSSMSIDLAQEVVQITVKYFFYIAVVMNFPANILFLH